MKTSSCKFLLLFLDQLDHIIYIIEGKIPCPHIGQLSCGLAHQHHPRTTKNESTHMKNYSQRVHRKAQK